MAGLARRRLYKPERPAARTKGAIATCAPMAMLDAGEAEVVLAILALCREAGIIVGRGGEYDPLRDKYTVIGKSRTTGKAQEITIEGEEVANVIGVFRQLNGGRARKKKERSSKRQSRSLPGFPV